MAEAPTNWIDFAISLSPVLQTGVWVGAITYCVWMLKTPLQSLVLGLVQRINQGDDFRTPWISVEKRKKLEQLENAESAVDIATLQEEGNISAERLPSTRAQWQKYRDDIYADSHGIFLVHVISPSKLEGQEYDIFIYLKCHGKYVIDEVVKAEFFLGKYWGNKVISEHRKGDLIGFKTSAYGPFLCVCKVILKDGTELMLNRYIDFEMGGNS